MLGFAAVNTGNNLLFLVVSSLLGFMAVSGFVGWLNIRNVVLTVDFPDEIYAGKVVPVPVRLQNVKKHIPSFLLRVDVFGESVLFPVVGNGDVETSLLTVTFPKRGESNVGRVFLSSSFPINFFTRTRTLAVDSRCIIFPSPLNCSVADGSGKRDARGETFSSRKGYGGEVVGIRDYGRNDSPRLIHWRLSARHDKLKVKELTSSSETPLVIDVLSLSGGNLEENLSCGAFLINRLIHAGRPVGLKLGECRYKPDSSRAHRLNMLTELALYGKS